MIYDKFCITSSEVRQVFGELTEEEKWILEDLAMQTEHQMIYTKRRIISQCSYDDYSNPSGELISLLTGYECCNYGYVGMNSIDRLFKFINFVVESLNGENKLFDFFPYGGTNEGTLVEYSNILYWISRVIGEQPSLYKDFGPFDWEDKMSRFAWFDYMEGSVWITGALGFEAWEFDTWFDDKMSIMCKLQNVLDSFVVPKILSIKYDEFFDDYDFADGSILLEYGNKYGTFLDYREFVSTLLGYQFDNNILSKAKIYCILGSFHMGVSKMWEEYKQTDYVKKIALFDETSVKESFDDLFKSVDFSKDIKIVDDRVTIVNNSEIYQTVLPKEILDYINFQEERYKVQER